MKWGIALCLLARSTAAGAVVIRSDVDVAAYWVPATTFSVLVELPGEGQGRLIAPKWLVTEAHTMQGYMLLSVD